MCAPLVAALRDAGHAVGMALSDRNRDIFAPGILAACHVLERIPWPRHGSTPESAHAARAAIGAANYDVALIASEEPEAYELASDIPQRVGFTTGWAKPLKSVWVFGKLTRRVARAATVHGSRAHEVETVFRLGAGLHAEPAPTRDPRRLRPLIVSEPARRGEHVVVQLGRKWSAIGLDPASAGAIVEALVARGARLVVTPDTGAAHLAGMLGVPVVDCFPDADAPAQIARWHPWAAPYLALVAGELRGSGGVARMASAVDAL